MTNTSTNSTPRSLDPGSRVATASYVYPVIVALFVILSLPLVSLTKRWLDRRRRLREAAIRRYEAIEKELCSPEELFAEKLLNEEYDDALDIANRYKLNADPVFQKQWLKEEITVESISNFLVQVRDRHWILSQCLTRVPDSLAATWAIIELGISLTDSDYFPAINAILLDENGAGSRDLKRLVREDFSRFSDEEKELVLIRCQMMRFKRRLETLERILGGEGIAEYHYKADVYKRFREHSVLESAVNFARSASFDAVSILFTHHGDDTLDHWLLVLSNIPEVVSPFLYQKLLPDCGISDSEVYGWEEDSQQDEDWSDIFMPIERESDAFADRLYGQPEFRELTGFKGRNLTKSLLTKWFDYRARQIEDLTNLVDSALQLVKLGIQKNLTGLMQLHQDLEIFSTLIYDCFPRVDSTPDLLFDEFLLLKPDKVIDLLMIGSEKDSMLFVRCIRNFLLPYIQKIDKDFRIGELHVYLEQFLMRTAVKDLSLLTAVFQSCVEDQDQKEDRIMCRAEDLLRLALHILYQDLEPSPDLLDHAFSIVECLPQRTSDASDEISVLQDRVDVLEKHLAVCEACSKHSSYVLPRRLLRLQDQKKESEVLLFFQKIISRGAKSAKSLNEAEWIGLLNDVVLIHRDCFSDVVSKEQVHHLFIRCLLTHGRKDFFSLAISLMKSLGVEHCTELIVEATRDYTNSANSLTDKSIQLAKTCLQLLSPDAIERHPAVRAERDFLEALNLMNANFSFSLLPIQIRLIEQPKLALIQKILASDPKAHRKFDQLLQVASLVQVCQGEERDSRAASVLMLAGEAAISHNDYSACLRICEELMSLTDTSGWRLCLKLGSNNMFSSKTDKLDLLSFALTYCDADDGGKRIALILKRIEDLQQEIRADEIRLQEQQELHRKVLEEGVNVITGSAQAITGGAQIFTSEVSKTAQNLTSWLLPTLKTIKKDIIEKGLPTRHNEPVHKLAQINGVNVTPSTSETPERQTDGPERKSLSVKVKERMVQPPKTSPVPSKLVKSGPKVQGQSTSDSQNVALQRNPVSTSVPKKKAKVKVIDDPTEDWDDWDSQASSTNTSRASSVKSMDLGKKDSLKKEKKLLVVEDDNDGNWDDW